jgi:hypothetical protein
MVFCADRDLILPKTVQAAPGGMLPHVKPETPPTDSHGSWPPHPDAEVDLREAIDAAERRALLSPEAFLRWLEGSGDESLPDELDWDADAAGQPRRNDSGA